MIFQNLKQCQGRVTAAPIVSRFRQFLMTWNAVFTRELRR